jgi:16S rRNA (cytidine1402-2'-O)-methyltransferase
VTGVPGRIVLVATPIGNLGDLSPRATETLATADVIGCEDTRHTRKLLTAAGISGVPLVAVHGHNEAAMAARLVGRAQAGETVAVVSDAGMPGVSDPGQRVVAGAAAAGVAVEIVPGPSAALAALVLSGLPTERFCFEGFLPRQGGPRRARLSQIAMESRTIVLYESPHHLLRTLEDLVGTLEGPRQVALARELTKLHEEVWRGSLADAVTRVSDGEQRGEWVVVIAGAVDPEVGDEEIRAALGVHLDAGAEAKAAVAAVTAELGVPRRRVYAQALSLRRKPDADKEGRAGGHSPT